MDPHDDIKPRAEMIRAKAPSEHGIAAELVAVLVAVTSGEPRVLTIQDQSALPSGPFELDHRSLQSGLRAWVERQTRLPLGYVEQLYTFADRDRAGVTAKHVISVSYLGLTREQPATGEYEASWHSWYDYFPWEDHRQGEPPLIEKTLRRVAAALDGGAGRTAALQAELSPLDRRAGTCRGKRRHEPRHRRPAGKIVQVPPRGIRRTGHHREQIADCHLTRLILNIIIRHVLDWSITYGAGNGTIQLGQTLRQSATCDPRDRMARLCRRYRRDPRAEAGPRRGHSRA